MFGVWAKKEVFLRRSLRRRNSNQEKLRNSQRSARKLAKLFDRLSLRASLRALQCLASSVWTPESRRFSSSEHPMFGLRWVLRSDASISKRTLELSDGQIKKPTKMASYFVSPSRRLIVCLYINYTLSEFRFAVLQIASVPVMRTLSGNSRSPNNSKVF